MNLIYLFLLPLSDYPNDPWSRQVSFPGGKRELTDNTDLDTATRETQEEIGLDLTSPTFTFIGQLDDRLAYSKGQAINLSISAFVFLQQQQTHSPIHLEKGGEVSAALWVPCDLLTESNINWTNVESKHTVFPILGLLPKSLLRLLGLSITRFPSIALHTLNTEQTELFTAPLSVSETCVLPFNLWGLTLRLTEDLLHHISTKDPSKQPAPLGALEVRPQLLFEDRRLGSVANIFLKRYNTKY